MSNQRLLEIAESLEAMSWDLNSARLDDYAAELRTIVNTMDEQ